MIGLAGSTGVNAQPAEAGLWYDDTGRGAVELVPCGTKLCGRIAWLKETVNAEGQPWWIATIPIGPSHHPHLWFQVIGDVQKASGRDMDQGWIYDPKTGSSYNVAITLQGPDQLKVTGYRASSFSRKALPGTARQQIFPDAMRPSRARPKRLPAGESLPWAAR